MSTQGQMCATNNRGAGMRVLVTGHTGYIGTVLTQRFQDAGHEVRGLDSGLFEACLHGPSPGDPPTVRSDIRDVPTEALDGIEAVVHLAAISNDPMGELATELTHQVNHRASVQLAEAAKAAGVRRYLYSSSCSVYGASDIAALVDETAPFAPVSAYAQSKVAVEGDLQQLANDDFSPTSLRNATVYGWSPRVRLDLVLNDLVASAYLTGQVLVLSDGTPWRPIVHVDDVATAFLLALEAPRDVVHNRAFNVGSEQENYQVRDIAHLVAEAVPGSTVEIAGQAGPDTRSYRVSFDRIHQELGFEPRWNARRGAEDLYTRLQDYGLTDEQYRIVYKRLGWLLHQRDHGLVSADLRTSQTADTSAV